MDSDVNVADPDVFAVMLTTDESALPHVHAAITRNDPDTEPALYSPFTSIVPPVAEKVAASGRCTPSLQVADTWNCCDAPAARLADPGVSDKLVT